MKLPANSGYFQDSMANIRESSNEDIVNSFCHTLEEEAQFRKDRGMDYTSIKSYLKSLFTPSGILSPLGIAGYTHRLAAMLDELKERTNQARILDAGCGYGTESLFFSLFGNPIIGVELVKERLEIANSRVEYFQSISKSGLDLNFINADIFRFLEHSKPFDVIWVMEAISHIYPPEKFIELAYERLAEGGALVISDPNSLNPLAWLRSVKIRGSLKHIPHQKFKDPETEKPVCYGQEQIFSFFRLRRILKNSGFKIKRVDLSGFMGSSFLPRFILNHKASQKILEDFQNFIKGLPIIRAFGSIYSIVAIKPTNKNTPV